MAETGIRRNGERIGSAPHFGRHFDVGWFQIAMNDSALMRIFERLRHLSGVVQRRTYQQRAGRFSPSPNSMISAPSPTP